jgi:Ca2+-binding RTX toxin-like protein
LIGGYGNDEIDGRGGADVLEGFYGADTITSQDGAADDVVDCGGDVDPPAKTDAGDTAYNCEQVVAAVIEQPPVLAPDTVGPIVVLGGRSRIPAKTFAKRRGVSLTVTPNEPAALFGEALGRGRLARAGDLVLGERSLAIGSGKRTLRLRFKKSFVRAINRRLRRKAYRLTVRVTATDAAGNATVQTRRITIKRRR